MCKLSDIMYYANYFESVPEVNVKFHPLDATCSLYGAINPQRA